MKKFVCKAKLVRKEGYTGIFISRNGVKFKLPYKDLKVREVGDVYLMKTTGQGHFEIFRPGNIIQVPFYKGKNGN